MNDTKLADAVKIGLTEACDSLSTVHLDMPASEIMARGDEARRRRRMGALAGSGGLAAVAVAVGLALPAGHPAASHPAAGHPAAGPGARLAAWTVTRQAEGTIQITMFGDLRDPAALQRALRADGVPASVTFIGQQNPACRVIPGPVLNGKPQRPAALDRVVPVPPHKVPKPAHEKVTSQDVIDMVIRPSALPSGDGLQIAVMRGIPQGPAGPWPYPKGSGDPVSEVSLVAASPQCTGTGFTGT